MLTEIVQMEDYDQAKADSQKGRVFLMKHSNICGTSFVALEEFKQFYESHKDVACYLLTIQEQRDISNAIAKDTDVEHKSPQVLIFNKKKIQASYTHYSITCETLEVELNKSTK